MQARLLNFLTTTEPHVSHVDMSSVTHTSKQKKVKKYIESIFDYLDEKSNPMLMQRIINTLGMDKLKSQNMYLNTFINKIKHEAIDLTKMRNAIASRLSKNKVICELIYFIEVNQLISVDEIKKLIPLFNTQLNVLCLLEAFSITMSNDDSFGEEMYHFIIQQRHVSQPGNPIFNFFASTPNKFSFFKSLKLISVDPAITAFAFIRSLAGKALTNDEIIKKSEAFINKYGLKYFNKNILSGFSEKERGISVKNVSLNILEAVWEDGSLNANHKYNAYTGAGLIRVLEYLRPQNSYVICDKVVPKKASFRNSDHYHLLPDLKINTALKYTHQFNISKEWMDLYISWNLLFVLKHFDYQFLALKLLLPSVLDALPKHFIETRVLTLFLFGNLFHFNKLDFFPKHTSDFTHKERILAKWYELNYLHADEMLKEINPDPNQQLSKELYEDMLGNHTNLSFAYHIINFFINSEFKIFDEKNDLSMDIPLASYKRGVNLAC